MIAQIASENAMKSPPGSKGNKSQKVPETPVMRRPPGVNKFVLKAKCLSLQLYADYEVESYMMKGNKRSIYSDLSMYYISCLYMFVLNTYLYVRVGYSSEDIHHLFAAKWKSEVHTGVLLPFDVNMSIALDFDDTKVRRITNC